MSDRKRLLVLIGIMAGVAVAVAVLSIWLLYQAAFSQQRDHLAHLVQSEAMMVGTMVERYVAQGLNPESVLANALDQFDAASKGLEAFGETGALMLGRRVGDEIRFLFGGHRPGESGEIGSVPFASPRSEPMRRAISGQSGTMIGQDFRGVQVLAAYRPVPQLNLGMVAKIDMLEVRRPFIRAGAISSAGAILIILLGTAVFRRISSPLVDNLEQAVARLTEAQRVARLGNWERDIATGDGWWSDETYRIFGLEPGAVSPTLRTFLEIVHPDDRDMVRAAIDNCLAGKAPYSIEYRIHRADGHERTIHARGTWRKDESGSPEQINGTVQDITQRRQTETDVRRLVSAIEGLAENFALYGPDDRMIMCNQGYRRLNSQLADATRPGVTFEEHARAMVTKGLVPDAKGRGEEWVRERMERHRNPKGPFEMRRQDGIWLHVREQRMADGSIATISTDISERKRAEERLQDAIETISDGFAFYDADERLVMANSRYIVNEEMRGVIVPGLSFEKILRAGIKAGIYPDSVGREEEWLAERLAHFRNPEGILEQPQRDGGWMQIAERKTADGGTVAIFTDITQRKEAEAELERQKTLFEAVFRDVPDAMVLTDQDRNIVMCNPAMTRAFGYEAEAVKGMKTDFLYASVEEWERQGRIRFNLSAELQLAPYVVNYRRKSGEIFPGETVGTPIRDREGHTLGYIGVIRDISARVQAEENLRRALVKAEEASHAKSQFLATMSHELRTPLNSIIGFSETLKAELFGPLGGPKYQEYAEDINVSGHHLLALINDILDISKIEAGEVVVADQAVDLPALVDAGIKMLWARAEDEGITLARVFPMNCPRLRADPRHIKQILINLVSNAIKFTPPGGKITVEVAVDDDNAFSLTISDTGIGIDDDHIATVLEPFAQVGDVYSRTHEGTGLGLPLAKSLTELHGGTLSIDSTPGRGTRVTARFPPERTEPQDLPLAARKS